MNLTPEQIEEQRREVEDLQAVMATEAGRRFVWSLLGRCGTFHGGWSPSAEIHLKAGMRQIGLMYLADVHEHCFEAYQAMEREAHDAEMMRRALKKQEEQTDG
jgi:hypothetical protein